MKKLLAVALMTSALLLGCATKPTVPVAVSCPPSPPLPAVLTQPKSSGPTLSERIENSFRKFEQSVTTGLEP